MLYNVLPFYQAPGQKIRFGVVRSADLCTGHAEHEKRVTWFSSDFEGFLLHVADAWEERDSNSNLVIKLVGLVFKEVCIALTQGVAPL